MVFFYLKEYFLYLILFTTGYILFAFFSSRIKVRKTNGINMNESVPDVVKNEPIISSDVQPHDKKDSVISSYTESNHVTRQKEIVRNLPGHDEELMDTPFEEKEIYELQQELLNISSEPPEENFEDEFYDQYLEIYYLQNEISDMWDATHEIMY